MTTRVLVLLAFAYAAMLAAIVYCTRPTARRLAGAIAGGAAAVLVGAAGVPIGEARGWWHASLDPSAGFRVLLCLVGALSTVPIFLVTWRIARRFGGRGLTWTVVAVAVIGPPREFAVAALFPQWIRYAPGIGPVIGVVAVYVGGLVAGHGVMRLLSGPASCDRLALRSGKYG